MKKRIKMETNFRPRHNSRKKIKAKVLKKDGSSLKVLKKLFAIWLIAGGVKPQIPNLN